MNILFAIDYKTDKKVQETILMEFNKKYNADFTYECEFYIKGVETYLSKHDVDILVLNENLEKNSVDTKFIDTLTDKYPKLRIILAMSDKHKEDTYTKRLYSLGVYDCLYFSDFNIAKIVDLLERGRTKRQAKDYYEIESVEDIDIEFNVTEISEEELEHTFVTLEKANNENRLSEIFKLLEEEYDFKEMLYLVTMLSPSLKEALEKSKNKTYQKYVEALNKEVKSTEVKTEVVEKIKEVKVEVEKIKEVKVEVEKIKEVEKPVIIEKEVIKVNTVRYDSVITLVSGASTGKTYLGWNLAHALSKHYKVAFLNIDNDFNANAYFGIDLNEDTAFKNLEDKDLKDIINCGQVVNKNLTVYTGEFGVKPHIKNDVLFKVLNQLRTDNHVVIIDTATGFTDNLITAMNYSNDIIFVYDLDNAHLKLTDRLLDRVSENININNTIAVINNAYQGSKELSKATSHLKDLERFRDILDISNAGSTTYDYMYSNTCNFIKEKTEFSNDIENLISTLRLRGEERKRSKVGIGSLFGKLIKGR